METKPGKSDQPASPAASDNVLTLCHMLSNRIGRAFISDMAKFDVTIPEWRVLLTLALHGNTSGYIIAGRWAMDKMAVNRAIARLEERGLIEKQRNDKDRRIIDLSLTRAGRTMYDRLIPVANERYHKLMAGLDRAEARAFRDLLSKMIMHADDIAH